jgi:hypothetical protein
MKRAGDIYYDANVNERLFDKKGMCPHVFMRSKPDFGI